MIHKTVPWREREFLAISAVCSRGGTNGNPIKDQAERKIVIILSFSLCLLMYTLVEFWAWDQPDKKLAENSGSSGTIRTAARRTRIKEMLYALK